jgi:hypothetical protein
MSTPTTVTYSHATAGSTVIMPNGKVMRFMGKPNSVGFYETTDPAEQGILDDLCRNPQVQMQRVANTESAVQAPIAKPADPAIEAAVQDAQANTVKDLDPNLSKLRDNLANVIKAG